MTAHHAGEPVRPRQQEPAPGAAPGEVAGTISALWRFPVKSMQGEAVDACAVDAGGIVGDRTYALLDVATGRVASAKNVRLFPGMLDCQASFVDAPATGGSLAAVRVVLPDGTAVRSDETTCAPVLSRWFGRDVRLVSARDQRTRVEGFVPLRETGGDSALGASLLERLGLPAALAADGFQDLFALSLLTTGTLRRLAAIRPGSRFDIRRFRMNVIVETPGAEVEEGGWVHRRLEADGSVRAYVAMPDARCAMTTLAQGDLPKDPEVLRTLARHSMAAVPGVGDAPCAGVYATVEGAGVLRVGATLCRSPQHTS